MFQTFDTTADPSQGPARLAELRKTLEKDGLSGFIIPRSDAHQGEYVAARDERLQWLTGFTGSAGFAVVLPDIAGVFIDGRYRTQVKGQIDLKHFTPVPWPEVTAGDWITKHMTAGTIGFDPWLHTADEVSQLRQTLERQGITLTPVTNYVDQVWPDQPPPPCGRAFLHPETLAGESSADKRERLARQLRDEGQRAAVITLPDSICWLLNIRGSDVPRNPILHGFALLMDDGRVTLFTDPAKFDVHTLYDIRTYCVVSPADAFVPALRMLSGPVRVDKTTAPLAISQELEAAGIECVWGDDPCRLAKACKNDAEIAATRTAHLRDGAAMVEFLCWLDGRAPQGGLTEIDVVTALEGFRRATNMLHDLSFDTIAGAGPNGAIMHYRVTHATNRTVGTNDLLLVDSGGQYVDGTTDITRTVAIGDPGPEARLCYTRVLQGLIAISRLRFPKGRAGRDLDGIARYPLWLAGQDYDHGTGHGVGTFLSVHEGPQRLSYTSDVPFKAGMILSNEPGYYREGEFGIRLENLIVVIPAAPLGDNRDHLAFETLTFAPFDRRLVLAEMLAQGERDWLNAYHAEVRDKLMPRLTPEAAQWLVSATASI